jgi:hypothetical protein
MWCALFSGGEQQTSHHGSRCVLCGWNAFPVDDVSANKFITMEHGPVRTAKSLSKHLDQVLQVYKRADFDVRTISMDGEFEKLKDILPTIECNTTVAKELMSEAERSIRTVKEQIRGLIGTLLFDNIAQQTKIKFMYTSLYCGSTPFW